MATIRDLIDMVGGDLDVEVTVPDPDAYADTVHPAEPRVSRVDDPSSRTVIVLDPRLSLFIVLADINPL